MIKKMKTKLFTILTLIVLSVVSQGFAAEGSKVAPKASDAVAELVKAKIQFPKFLKKEGISKTQVIVEFKVKEDGTLNILSTNQNDERVKNYVIEQMENINILDANFESNEVYVLKLNFQLL
jgi:outer membrane lipoprotein-sorting protein